MHQTFYIDIDEEITSIVEKLKHARVGEIIMVVPKHALLIQSIVNLRILKKEADDAGMQLMIVTQDKLGKILVEKAGIFVQQKMDNISDEEIDANIGNENVNQQAYNLENARVGTSSEKSRLAEIGSKEYFTEGEIAQKEREFLEKKKKTLISKKIELEKKENVVNRELVRGAGEEVKKSIDISPIAQKNILTEKVEMNKNEKFIEQRSIPVSVNLRPDLPKDFSNAVDFSSEKIENHQDKKIESFFYQQNDLEKKFKKNPKDNLENYNLSGGSHKFFWFFGLATMLIIAGIGAYLFLPKVDLKIITKMEKKSIDSEITGLISATLADYDKKIIPAKSVSISEELLKTFNATGDKAVSNQKARGKIIIYNEYNSSSQPLVDNTRFLSEGGKLFRLVKGVTIPGMTKVGGEMKPGTIEAEVVADQAGKDFNIKPSKFTIPGFENSGGGKYTKFYGKSEQDMSGGGDSGEKINSVTEEDITAAKKSITDSVDDFVKQKLKEKAGSNAIVLDDAIKKEEIVFNVSNYPGDIASSFNVSALIKAETMAVEEKNFKEMIGYMISGNKNNQSNLDYESMALDFGKTSIDFKEGTINIKFHVSGKMNPNINLDEIKKGILGKSEESLKAYLSSFTDIKQIELVYWPTFLNDKIPFLESRVNVILDKQ